MQQWVLNLNLSEYFIADSPNVNFEWAISVYNTSISYYGNRGLQASCVNSMDEAFMELARSDRDFVLISLTTGDLDKKEIIEKIKVLREITTAPIQISLIESSMEISEVSDLLAHGADVYTFHKMDAYSAIEPALEQSYSLIRRYTDYNHKEEKRQNILYVNDLLFLLHSRRVFYKSNEIVLTKKEYDILLLLAKNIGIVLPYSRIYERIWGDEYSDDTPNAVQCQVRRIRDKIKKHIPSTANSIKTIQGVGYRFEKI